MSDAIHVPVMVNEVVAALPCASRAVIVDGTLGLGGYAAAILKACAPDGVVLGCDVDVAAVQIAQQNLAAFGARMRMVQGSYADIPQYVQAQGWPAVDGICIDIGVSSLQLDQDDRGFSFQRQGPLDMRMNTDLAETAADLVNTASAEDMAQWFWDYGEERYSRRIAQTIVRQRVVKPFENTLELADCVRDSVPANMRHGRLHPATRVFQALRIVVNQELQHLETFLATAPPLLKSGGRVVVVSYHSLEDRLVKQAWKRWAETKQYRIITKRPQVPSDTEVASNPRARSAKMRVLERVES